MVSAQVKFSSLIEMIKFISDKGLKVSSDTGGDLETLITFTDGSRMKVIYTAYWTSSNGTGWPEEFEARYYPPPGTPSAKRQAKATP